MQLPLISSDELSDRRKESSHVQDPSRRTVSPSGKSVQVVTLTLESPLNSESLQRMKAVVVELQEIEQEEEAVISEFIRLTEDDAGKVSLPAPSAIRQVSLPPNPSQL